MHYYKFNIADWSLGTSHLSLVEEAIYFRLINFYYDSEQPLPLETHSVFRRLRMASESVIAQQIIDEFFTKTDKGYIHERCDILLKEYRKTAKNNRSNGAKGGRPKKDAACEETQTKPSGFISETQQEPKHNPNQEPLTINQEPLTNKKEKPTGKPLVNFSRWLELVRDAGQKPIPTDSPIFEYAQDAGIDPDYLRLAWVEFKARYTDDSKRYKDWRSVFSKAVRGNWFKLWWHDGNGYQLTALGQQNMAAMKTRDKREDQ